MNIRFLMQRLLGQATCVKQATTRIGSSARIINIVGDSRLIYLGSSTVVNGELLVFPHGGKITIGDWCFIGEGTRLWSGSNIAVGDRVMISHNVNIFDNQTHPLSPRKRHEHFKHIIEIGHPVNIELADNPIRIEDDAWIATGAIILKGVSIGRGAIVAAGSVVTKDVPSFCIAAGNPARVIRKLTPDEIGTDFSF